MDTNNRSTRVVHSVRRRSLDGFDTVWAASREQSVPKVQSPAESPAQAPVSEPVDSLKTENFSLPRYQAPNRPLRPLKRRRAKKLIVRGAGLALMIVLMTGGFLTWKGYTKFHKVFHGTTTVAALAGRPVAPEQLKGEGDGRVNILLLGIGGPGHDGPDLTDTMMVLSVDPVNDTAAMLSVPRDLWVKMPVNYLGSVQKINAAYESGKYAYLGKIDASSTNANAVEAGFKSADEAVSQVLGINISYHVLVDFQAFRQAIDTVGAVTVDVPSPLVDPTMAWENNWNPILAPAGVQQMDGKQALLYARSRETTSDFARTERQRQIMVALKDKVLTAGTLSNPAKIDELLNAFGDNVYSDMSTQGALRLMSILKKVSNNKINSLSLVDPPHQLVTTDHVGNISVVRPVAGFDNYAAIQQFVRSQLPDGYLVKEHAEVTVVGQTSAGAAATATLLESYGYNVTATLTTTQKMLQSEVVDLSGGKDPYTRHYLTDRYSVTPLANLPHGVNVPAGSAKFVILTNN